MQLRHLLIALVVPLTWGFGFALAKAGLDHFPPLLLMSMRFAIAAAILVWLVPVPRGHWWSLTIITLVSATLQYGMIRLYRNFLTCSWRSFHRHRMPLNLLYELHSNLLQYGAMPPH